MDQLLTKRSYKQMKKYYTGIVQFYMTMYVLKVIAVTKEHGNRRLTNFDSFWVKVKLST